MTRPALALALLLALAALVAGHRLPAPGRYGVTLVLLTAGVTLAVQAGQWLRAAQPPSVDLAEQPPDADLATEETLCPPR